MVLNHMKCLASVSAVILGCVSALAADITGKVIDSSGEPLMEATVKLLVASDSSFVKGVTTSGTGTYTFKDVKPGRYVVQTSYIGYDNATIATRMADHNVTVRPITLKESSIMLKEMTVTGVKTAITAKEDTLEYNAASFKTQPNAVMEDLLKKLPGVEVGTDGKITAGGKTVSKILVDGKEFFSDDTDVATKNLPVDMIEKLQVIDRKSDLARATGVDDGEEETVINLTVKQGMNNGWFGQATAGYGTNNRYAGDVMVNRFWNGNQVSLIGNANNVNRRGFMDRGGSFTQMGGGGGITTTQSLGMNFNVGRKDESFRVGGDVMYSHTGRESVSDQSRHYLMENYPNPYQRSLSVSTNSNHNINGNFRMKWQIDSASTFEFRPNMSMGFNSSTSNSKSASSINEILTGVADLSNMQGLSTRSTNDGNSDGKRYSVGGEMWYTYKFLRHKGRSFSIQGEYSLSNQREDTYSKSTNAFELLDSVYANDQYIDNHNWSNSVGGRITWTEPIGNPANGNSVELSYRANYRWNNADKLVYDYPVTYDDKIKDLMMRPVVDYLNQVFNDSLSNQFRNDNFSQRAQIGLRRVTKVYNLNVGLALQPTMSKSINLINDAKSIPTRWVLNFAPFLRYRHKFSQRRTLNIDYRGRSQEASMAQLQPVADYSNPMRVVQGNPELDPSFNHNVNLRFNDFDMDTQRNIMLSAGAGTTQNAIVSSTEYMNDGTGRQITTYKNVNGNWNANMFSMVSFPLRNKNWQVSANLMASYNESIGFTNGKRNTSSTYNLGPSISLAFRPENWEFSIRPHYNIRETSYSIQTSQSTTVQTYGGRFDFGWYAPFGLVLASDLTYSDSKGYAAGYDAEEWMWNASIGYQFLKGKAATVRLQGYDLLQQRKSISFSTSTNATTTTSTNSLTRYFMLTFSYRFNVFSGMSGRRGGQSGFGPGMDGPGGGPGMGGPGGGMGGGFGGRH